MLGNKLECKKSRIKGGLDSAAGSMGTSESLFRSEDPEFRCNGLSNSWKQLIDKGLRSVSSLLKTRACQQSNTGKSALQKSALLFFSVRNAGLTFFEWQEDGLPQWSNIQHNRSFMVSYGELQPTTAFANYAAILLHSFCEFTIPLRLLFCPILSAQPSVAKHHEVKVLRRQLHGLDRSVFVGQTTTNFFWSKKNTNMCGLSIHVKISVGRNH